MSSATVHRNVVSVRHGLDARLASEDRPRVCDCPRSRPVRLGGIWWGLDLYQCGRCGRKVVTE